MTAFAPDLLHKTISWKDLDEPRAREMSRRLPRFLLSWRLRGCQLAVNGVLRKRLYLRAHKMWEYARGLAYSEPGTGMNVLDFGGAATLPVFYLAARGARLKCLDVDPQLSHYTNETAHGRGLALEASTTDVTRAPFPPGWGPFDRVYSFCVIEHLEKPAQLQAMRLLAERLKPGGRLILTFDYGLDAPEGGALRDPAEVARLVEASGLRLTGSGRFCDTGERFVLNKRHPDRRFTFGSLFLEK